MARKTKASTSNNGGGVVKRGTQSVRGKGNIRAMNGNNRRASDNTSRASRNEKRTETTEADNDRQQRKRQRHDETDLSDTIGSHGYDLSKGDGAVEGHKGKHVFNEYTQKNADSSSVQDESGVGEKDNVLPATLADDVTEETSDDSSGGGGTILPSDKISQLNKNRTSGMEEKGVQHGLDKTVVGHADKWKVDGNNASNGGDDDEEDDDDDDDDVEEDEVGDGGDAEGSTNGDEEGERSANKETPSNMVCKAVIVFVSPIRILTLMGGLFDLK